MEKDKRFAHIKSDPKFRRIPKSERKVKIDKRFQPMFRDKKFKLKYSVDKRGKPLSHTSTEDLKRYYELSSSSEEESDGDDEGVQPPASNEVGENSDLNKDSDDKTLPDKVKKKLKDLQVDYARGESRLCSESSSDDEESESEASETDGIDHKWGELDADAEQTDKPTYRLAACNMDWDRMRATDLMVLFNSFLTPGAVIKSVAVYPSEFGKERMKEEDVTGPTELVKAKENDVDAEENEDGSEYHMEKLRQYQLNRLKYYYAIITCDSPTTANKIYTECDGMEYESSATKIDLRFVPDEMTFEDEPKETCDKLPDASKYQPRFFTTTALQQAKVDLTWDETDPERIELAQRLASGKATDVHDEDLKSYVALSSDEDELTGVGVGSESEDDSKTPIDKYKALLQEIENQETAKKEGVEMEITWGIDLKETRNEDLKREDKTPFQLYLEKRKAKKKERKQKKTEENDDVPSDVDMNDPYFAKEFAHLKKTKVRRSNSESSDEGNRAELELMLMNEDDEGKKHFSLKTIQAQENAGKSKKKRKKGSEVPEADEFEVNVEDQRFAALFTSHHYSIDPTDPHFKRTKGMERLISEKLKRRAEEVEETDENRKKPYKKNAELNVLVKSVKNKARAFNKK